MTASSGHLRSPQSEKQNKKLPSNSPEKDTRIITITCEETIVWFNLPWLDLSTG